MVLNTCFGTKVNETLGRLISAMLAQALGESIGINSDAYRITLELPGRIPPERIKDILYKTQPDTLDYLMKTILQNSTYLRWQLVHVARKFGALRKDFDYKTVGMKRLFNLFEQSLILEEALDKLLWERMDIQQTTQILQKIQQGKISVHIQGLSPIALTGFETIRGLMVPQRADRTILMALKKRLEEADITMACHQLPPLLEHHSRASLPTTNMFSMWSHQNRYGTTIQQTIPPLALKETSDHRRKQRSQTSP